MTSIERTLSITMLLTQTLKLKEDPNFDFPSLFSITDYLKNNESVIKIKENSIELIFIYFVFKGEYF